MGEHDRSRRRRAGDRPVAAYLFAPDGRRLARVSREEWDWALCLAGGAPEFAAAALGVDAPGGVEVFYGRTSRQALAQRVR
jgi:hypothetical protein